MKHQIGASILLLLLVLITSCDSPKKQSVKKPNIVLVLIDDEGYGDVGSYGATGFETPNIDLMASQGMKFTNFYAAQPVCSASRAGLLTGCYP
ncbi:MAG: sulfatase-like hydrolase/transferase, partial [Cyclobacteriaceae bacterium]